MPLQAIHPKLPMRHKATSLQYYAGLLQFEVRADYGDYLLLQKDAIELHLFHYAGLDPATNYGQVYIRVQGIEAWYGQLQAAGVPIHPHAPLTRKPWGQLEFALLDPDNNLLTFGEAYTHS